MTTIDVMLNGKPVPIERRVFTALLEQSVVNDRASVRKALETSRIPFRTLVELSRAAQIPYPLFFARFEVVDEQLKVKTAKLMSGFTKQTFSMHSRNRVRLADVELIVKDLLRKQELLKADKSLARNEVVGCLRRSRESVVNDASRLMRIIDLGARDIRNASTKDRALDLLIDRLEAKQIIVARGARTAMPQQVPPRAQFSGMTIKDTKVPFIFLSSGDEGEGLEPSGRMVFTLTLLTVLIASGTFAPVTYDGHTKDESAPREYQLTAQILMPADEFRSTELKSLDAVKELASTFKVTPSAVVMRAMRLKVLDRDTAGDYLDTLADEYSQREKQRLSTPLLVNALRKYNGRECSRRMLGLLDAGEVKPADFCRVMFGNRLRPSQIDEFRRAVR